MNKYTNISLDQIGELDGIPIMPCVKSGFCCTKAPCGYGEWNEDKSACKHLLPPNDLGQRDCARYEWIKANVPGWQYYPAFGAGCGSTLFNHLRDRVIKNIKTKTDESKTEDYTNNA